jgi:hypothetical protein
MDEIFGHWPNMATLASDIGVAHVRVRQWKGRKSIPAAYLLPIAEAAKRRKYPVTIEMLAGLRAKPTHMTTPEGSPSADR